MASRHDSACTSVTPATVKEIIATDLSDARINNFINFAYLVTLKLDGHLDDCGGSEALCAIQQLLAAHFLTAYEPVNKSERIGSEWSFTRFGQDGLGLDGSPYGQQAKLLDCSGVLASLGLRRAKISVYSIYGSLEARGLIDSDLI